MACATLLASPLKSGSHHSNVLLYNLNHLFLSIFVSASSRLLVPDFPTSQPLPNPFFSLSPSGSSPVLSSHLPPTFLHRGWRGWARQKSCNQEEIIQPRGMADLTCLLSESQLSAPLLNVFTCIWPVPLPSPSKASPALHCFISSWCKPSSSLSADSDHTPVSRHKLSDMTSLNFLFLPTEVSTSSFPFSLKGWCFPSSNSNLNFSDFPGSPVVKNPPANAGDTGFKPWSGKIPHAVSHNYWACTPRAHALQQKKPPQWEARTPPGRVASFCRN